MNFEEGLVNKHIKLSSKESSGKISLESSKSKFLSKKLFSQPEMSSVLRQEIALCKAFPFFRLIKFFVKYSESSWM